MPIHNAVATSAALGLPIALASTAGYVVGGWNLPPVVPGAFGYVVLPMLALIVGRASMSTAPLGARVAHATDIGSLTVVFAALLYALAAYMVWRGADRAEPSASSPARSGCSPGPRVAAAPARFGQRSLAGGHQVRLRVRGVREAGHAHRHA